MAGLRVGQAFGVLLLPGFGVSSSSPQVPGYPTSISDTDRSPVSRENQLLKLAIINETSDMYKK